MILLEKIKWYLKPYFKKSYSQSGEDIIISRIFKKLKIEKITYLDLGTNHPKWYNNTYLFYKNGNSGTCIEPDIMLFKKIKKIRKRDQVLNVAVSTNSEPLTFYIFDSKEQNTTIKEEADKKIKMGFKLKNKIIVPSLSLTKIINSMNPPNLISLDVEGLDEEIIKSFDFSYRPTVWCIETIEEKDGFYIKNNKIKKIMEENNYFMFADTNINSIFVDMSVYKELTSI